MTVRGCPTVGNRLVERAGSLELVMSGAPGAKQFIESELVNVQAEQASCGCGTTRSV